MPVCGELPFPDHLDRKDEESFERVWDAQVPQIAIPFMGLPGAGGLHRVWSARRPSACTSWPAATARICCLLAGEAIEAGGVPPSPIDPAGWVQ